MDPKRMERVREHVLELWPRTVPVHSQVIEIVVQIIIEREDRIAETIKAVLATVQHPNG